MQNYKNHKILLIYINFLWYERGIMYKTAIKLLLTRNFTLKKLEISEYLLKLASITIKLNIVLKSAC